MNLDGCCANLGGCGKLGGFYLIFDILPTCDVYHDAVFDAVAFVIMQISNINVTKSK